MRKRALLLGAVLALLAMADTAGAQTATGQITGTVKDATGAVVPGASVTVHSDLTGLTRTGATIQAATIRSRSCPPACTR